MEDERQQSTILSKSKGTTKSMENILKLKTLDLGAEQGFTCDAETGICGPNNQEKEANK